MIHHRRSVQQRMRVRFCAVLAVGTGCLVIQAAPPGHGQRASTDGINSAVLQSGRYVPVHRVPTASPVYAMTESEAQQLGQAPKTRRAESNLWTNLTATGGPTGCELDIECDDCNPCTTDRCTAVTGTCSNDPRDDCSDCDDGLFCNGTDKCLEGTCTDAGQEKEFQCVSGPNEGRACFNDPDPVQVCSPDLNDPDDICQLTFVNTDPCRFFLELICDEEEPTGSGESGACVAYCDVDADCNDNLACNGAEICVKDPSVAGHGGECVGDTTTTGDPCTTAGDCLGAAPICGGVCRPDADNGPPCRGAICEEGDPVTCGPGRCCTPDGNDWSCQRATVEDCSATNGFFLGVGDLSSTGFDDADAGGGTCLERADETFPDYGESFLCPKYSAGITDGNVVDVLGQAGAAGCHPYWEIGDDYHLSNCKEAKDTWYEVWTVRWIGGHVRGTGSRMLISFYDKDGRFVADRITPPALDLGIVRQTVIFPEGDPLIIPCNGFITLKPAVSFSKDNLAEWAVTDQLQVGTTDAFVYVRKHGICTNAPTTGCNENADCGADGPCVITSGALADDKVAPLEPIAVPGGGAGLAFEIVGRKVSDPSGACCNGDTGTCELKPSWVCDAEGGYFWGLGTTCSVCSNDFFQPCELDSDCWVCVDGGNNGGPCPGGDTDCPDGSCNETSFCMATPPPCQTSACCDPITATCTTATGGFCEGDPLRPCFGDGDCELNEECLAPCPEGTTASGFGTFCEPNCCPGLYGPGADTCATADAAPISVPTLGDPPVTVTITGNNKGATFGDYVDGTCPQKIFDELGAWRDRGWWHAFQIDDCADVRIDMCCTAEISGEIHQPQYEHIYADCDPCTRRILPKTTGFGSFVPEPPTPPLGSVSAPTGRGEPFCDSDDKWYTFRDLPAGTYYVPIFTAPGGHFGDYQLHITASACQEVACCLPEPVCVQKLDSTTPGPLNGQTCSTNEDCAPLEEDRVCVGDNNRPNELCCPDGACDNDPDNPTCVGGTRDTLPCCDGGGECKGNCTADCAITGKPLCESLDGYWMGFGNIPLGQFPTVSCDSAACETGSCCLGDAQCQDDADPDCTPGVDCCADGSQYCMSRKACAALGGAYVGGAECDYPKPSCPACEFQGEDNCHFLDGVNYVAISDLAAEPGGFVHADDILLTTPEVSQVCVWGAYFDARYGPDDTHSCAGEVIDKFRVRFYADDGGGKPDHTNILYDSWVASGDWLTELNGSVVKSDTTDTTETADNPLNLQVFSLSFPTATLPTAQTIWLEVVNNTDSLADIFDPVRNTCYWWWAQRQSIFDGVEANGNLWSYTGTEYRPAFGNISPLGPRPGETGYSELGHDWTDQVFCLSGPDSPANFQEPDPPTGCCCSCPSDGGFDEPNRTLAECTSHDSEHERRWFRNSVCPNSCLPPEGVPGDNCGSFSGSGTVAASFDCSSPIPVVASALQIVDGAFLASTVCADDSLPDSFPGGNFLGGDIFAYYTATCTGELVMSMCNTTIYYGNYDSFLAVYHDFDNPADCVCPDAALNFNVARSDENCNGEPDGGAGVFQGQIVFPGECWLARIGGWGSGPGAAAHGYARLDTACVHHDDCIPYDPPTLQTQFGGGNAPEPKSRYLAVNAGSPGHFQTIRVTWDASPNWPGGYAGLVGQQMYMTGLIKVCENSSQGLAVTPPNCGPSPGQPQRWFWAATLTCDSGAAEFVDLEGLTDYCTGSGEACSSDGDCAAGTCGVDGVVHLYHGAIAPSRVSQGVMTQPAEYAIQTIVDRCPLSVEAGYSDPLITRTAGWGDPVGGSITCPASLPNNSADLLPDVTSAVDKFSNANCAPKKTRVDVDHDFVINFPTDVMRLVNAFSNGGGGFTEAAPAACSAAAKTANRRRYSR